MFRFEFFTYLLSNYTFVCQIKIKKAVLDVYCTSKHHNRQRQHISQTHRGLGTISK